VKSREKIESGENAYGETEDFRVWAQVSRGRVQTSSNEILKGLKKRGIPMYQRYQRSSETIRLCMDQPPREIEGKKTKGGTGGRRGFLQFSRGFQGAPSRDPLLKRGMLL